VRSQIVGEVAIQVRGDRNDGVAGVVHAADDGLLPSEEDETSVLVNRTTDCGAELIALEGIHRRRKVIARVEDPVAYKLKSVTVPVVGARLGDNIHHRARIV